MTWNLMRDGYWHLERERMPAGIKGKFLIRAVCNLIDPCSTSKGEPSSGKPSCPRCEMTLKEEDILREKGITP